VLIKESADMAKMFSPPKQPTVTSMTAASAAQIETKPAPAPVPIPVPEPPPVTTPAPTPAPVTTPVPTPETDPSKAAELSLARRDRTINGTVLTSWRGVLQQTGSGTGALPARKRLLGE
jgi:hypothetical protein